MKREACYDTIGTYNPLDFLSDDEELPSIGGISLRFVICDITR